VTKDRGRNWIALTPVGLDNADDLNFVSSQVGWAHRSNAVCPQRSSACVEERQLLKTTDGGLHWVAVAVR